jgi:hypothetical protein
VFGLPLLLPVTAPGAYKSGSGAVTGSNNGSPNTAGYIFQGSYWPVQNIDLSVAYTGYYKFNGAATNYDGANRNASDNNTVYVALWVNF